MDVVDTPTGSADVVESLIDSVDVAEIPNDGVVMEQSRSNSSRSPWPWGLAIFVCFFQQNLY